MGAGKTTVGSLLAERLGWRFLDADHVLQHRTGRTVAQLFELHGEAGFRRMEAETVESLSGEANTVIALGGGAIEHEATRTLLSGTHGTYVIYLEASLDTMLARCRKSDTVRPLLADPENLAQRLDRRLPHYQSAHLTISTEGLPPASIVDRILLSLDLLENAPMKAGDRKQQ